MLLFSIKIQIYKTFITSISFNKMRIFAMQFNRTMMFTSKFDFTSNRLMCFMHTLFYLHDDTFLKNSKEFIH